MSLVWLELNGTGSITEQAQTKISARYGVTVDKVEPVLEDNGGRLITRSAAELKAQLEGKQQIIHSRLHFVVQVGDAPRWAYYAVLEKLESGSRFYLPDCEDQNTSQAVTPPSTVTQDMIAELKTYAFGTALRIVLDSVTVLYTEPYVIRFNGASIPAANSTRHEYVNCIAERVGPSSWKIREQTA